MYTLFFQPIISSPGERPHIWVRAHSVETGAQYSKLFLDLAELEPTLVNALHPQTAQLESLRNSLSEGTPCEWGGITGVPYQVDDAVIERFGLTGAQATGSTG
jgi:hypothetical protein